MHDREIIKSTIRNITLLLHLQAKLDTFEELKTLREPEVPLANTDRFAMEVRNRRQEPDEYYSMRDRRASWDSIPERDTDAYLTSPKEQLLDMIKLYNYLQSQRHSGRNRLNGPISLKHRNQAWQYPCLNY